LLHRHCDSLRASFSENHNQPITQQAPCGRRSSPKATDEGSSRENQRLTPLEHPSSVSALSRRSTFSHKEKEKTNFNQFLIFFARASGQGESALIL
ncbi:hypothetical protein LB565_22890, partial [Mesorhizobium sp. CA14]|uniref:hypothetical protein n=1 Tax=Mesorhizobium sp. CA14 TaxID=2876642 RepID=UPI001CCEA5BE